MKEKFNIISLIKEGYIIEKQGIYPLKFQGSKYSYYSSDGDSSDEINYKIIYADGTEFDVPPAEEVVEYANSTTPNRRETDDIRVGDFVFNQQGSRALLVVEEGNITTIYPLSISLRSDLWAELIDFDLEKRGLPAPWNEIGNPLIAKLRKKFGNIKIIFKPISDLDRSKYGFVETYHSNYHGDRHEECRFALLKGDQIEWLPYYEKHEYASQHQPTEISDETIEIGEIITDTDIVLKYQKYYCDFEDNGELEETLTIYSSEPIQWDENKILDFLREQNTATLAKIYARLGVNNE